MPACRVYSCDIRRRRNPAASWLAQAGVSSDEIADIREHSSTRITSTVYRRMRPDEHERVRAAWESDDAVAHTGEQRAPIRLDEGSELGLCWWAILGSNQ